ncbi:hypothetical protein C8Q78DRAFT_1022189 [Trametes maxima]|nr:hypothetical protein C8Q78DRAFT_1022189 [Trametes maxima]
MDGWPGYSYGQTATPEKNRSKGKAKDERVEGPWCYPVLDHGSLGAAILKKKYGRYEWSFAVGEPSEYRLEASGDPLEVFPPTRSRPWQGAKATELQQAEQGAHFLRTFYPDVDIQAELIRDEIKQDMRSARLLEREDPYAGNMVDVSSFHISRKNMAYVAFPMGETNCELNMSPLTFSTRAKVSLNPTVTPVYKFDTPIRQILASPHTPEIGKGKTDPVLAVRTMGSSTFLQLKVAVHKTALSIEPTPLVTVQRSDVEGCHVVDLAISPTNTSMGYVVNDVGAIFRCSAPEGKKLMKPIYRGEVSPRSLYRVAVSETRETLLSMSDKSVSLLDPRAGKNLCLLHAIARPDVALTSVESLNEDHIIRLVSSQEILWLDKRHTRKPLIAVKHGRAFDTTLRSQSCVMIGSPHTLLTSRRNSLVTVYDVSRGNENLVQLYGAPYSLPSVLRPDGPHSGYAFFQQPTIAGSKQLSIFQLSERGSLLLLNLQKTSDDIVTACSSRVSGRAEWPTGVTKLGENVETAPLDLGPLAARTHSVTGLESAYERLFMDRREKDLTVQSNAALDTLERMPSFWQHEEIPIEHALTTFDIAIRSGSEPVDASRNDWFTGSALDCASGYRALVQGRIPFDQLTGKAPWHLDIAPLIRRSVSEYDDDTLTTVENFSGYNLADVPSRTAPSFRREKESRSQLALDLSLAADVHVPRRPGKETPASFDEDMANISRSTEAMSLGDLEPPPMHFGFLRPVRKVERSPAVAEATQGAPALKYTTPLGVRLLLHEWEVGADPHQYTYRDPYDRDAPVPPFQARPAKSVSKGIQPGKQAQVQTQTLSQRPPAIVSSSTAQGPPHVASRQPPMPRKPLVAARSESALTTAPSRAPPSGSQPADNWSAVSQSSQPDFVTSTQVLPGPHGGRPLPIKKKPAKKRLGGF